MYMKLYKVSQAMGPDSESNKDLRRGLKNSKTMGVLWCYQPLQPQQQKALLFPFGLGFRAWGVGRVGAQGGSAMCLPNAGL